MSRWFVWIVAMLLTLGPLASLVGPGIAQDQSPGRGRDRMSQKLQERGQQSVQLRGQERARDQDGARAGAQDGRRSQHQQQERDQERDQGRDQNRSSAQQRDLNRDRGDDRNRGGGGDRSPADAVRPAARDSVGDTAGWYIVRLDDGAGDPGKVADRLAREVGIAVSHVYRDAFKGFAAQISPAQLHRVEGDADVRAVRPDEAVRPTQQEIPRGILRMEAAPASKNATARIDGLDERVDVDVAIVDSGIDQFHPELNYAGGKDCTGGNAPGTDGYGHGTHVAGIVGALDNGDGVVGVAPGARVWSVKVFNARGEGTLRTYFCGLEYVANNAAIFDVVNLSLATAPRKKSVQERSCRRTDSEQHKLICKINRRGVTIVAAAGNDGVDAKRVTPAAFDQVLTVSVLEDADGLPGNDRIPGFSNYGRDVDFAAPGMFIRSTAPGGGYDVKTGTSEAAPHVAGAAALAIASGSATTPGTVRAYLRANREAVALPGDRDRWDEGVINVNDGAPWQG